FCVRHYAKLSGPMRTSLAIARSEGGEKFRKQLAEAVEEVRKAGKKSDEWSRWMVLDDGRLERFEEWRSAVHRYYALVDDDHQPTIAPARTGPRATIDQIGPNTPHRGGFEEGSRTPDCPTLAKAIEAAEKRHAGGRWRGGQPPIVVGVWSCED